MKKNLLYKEKLDSINFVNIIENKKPSFKKIYVSNHYYILVSKDEFNLEIKKVYLKLKDHYIFLKKQKNINDFAYMNVKYCYIKLLPIQEIYIKKIIKVYGIRITKNKNYEEIYSENEKDIWELFNNLKKYCLLTKFRLNFDSKFLLGKGRFSKVFLVERKINKKQYACKIFDKKYISSDKKELNCLLYEIKMMKKMNYYRLCKLKEIYEGENYIYCLQELVKGKSLQESIIEKGIQSEKKSLLIIYQILEGLVYMHDKKLIHRDIKPENILFNNNDNIIDLVIIDFGFATYEKDYKKLFTRCGTPGFVAPEVLNDKEYNCKSDVFSVGIIFYILLTGKIPFDGNTYSELVLKNTQCIINFDLSIFETIISDNSINLLKELLEYDPKKRISSKKALLHEAFDLNEDCSPIKKITSIHQDVKNFFKHKYNLNKNEANINIPDDIKEIKSPLSSPISKRKSNNLKNLIVLNEVKYN